MITVAIAECTAPVRSLNPATAFGDGEFDYVDLSAVDQDAKAITGPSRLTGAAAPSRARQVLAAGDVLVSTVRPNLNAVARVGSELDAAIASTGFCVLRPTGAVDGGYLFHWVRSPAFIRRMVRLATGASYPAVSDRIVRESPLPLPPLAEQRRIAAALDALDGLREQRRRVLDLLEVLQRSLLESRLEQRRGSVAEVAVGDLASLVTKGTTPLDYTAAGIRFLRAQDLLGGTVGARPDALYIDAATDAVLKRSRIAPRDVLLSIAGTVGRVALVPAGAPPMNCNQAVAIVRCRDTVRPRYLQAALGLRSVRRQISGAAVTATISNLSLAAVRSLCVPLLPLPEQEAFESDVAHVAGYAGRATAQLAGLDALLSALQVRLDPARAETRTAH